MLINKKDLVDRCSKLLREQLNRIEIMMRLAQEEANKETKSSAGDKYETGRSMMQLEKEKYAIQHHRVLSQLNALKNIDLGLHSEVQTGSIVKTNIGVFFIAVGMESLIHGDQNIECISLSTPIGKVLAGLESGDVADFRDNEIEVWEVQ